jgi:hypothetical protein
MTRTPSPLLRAALAVALLSPSFASVQAAAQVVNASAASGTSAVAAVAGAAVRAPMAIGAMPLQAPSLSIDLAPSPAVLPSLAPSALAALPAASRGVPSFEAAPAMSRAASPSGSETSAKAAVAADAPAVHGAASALTGVFRPEAKSAAAPSPAAAEARMNLLFDGEGTRRAAESESVVAGLPSPSAASTLEKYAPAASAAAKAVPPAAKIKRAGLSIGVKVLLAAVIVIATPAVALAAPVAGPVVITAATSLSWLASIQPLAAAAGAVAGAIYGMVAARPKDGSSAPSGDVFASILRYGVMGGAGAYILLDLSQIVFTGTSAIGLQPLTSAIAVAALGRTAFQDKFTDPATTSADRVMGAFPAVAAAVGISVGAAMTALVSPALAFTIATSAMAATGVAAAIYAAIFKPGRSPLNGPSRMAKGYVLQALMMGLALAVQSNPYLFWPFALLGAAGFGLVLWTTALEIWAHRPGAPSQPLPPAPPATPPAAPKAQPL